MSFINKISLKKLLSNKKFTIVLSLLIALVLWLSIVINQTPNIENTITNLSVTIDPAGTVAGELGLDEITGVSATVTLKISGPAYVVGNLTENDFVVSPSFANVTAPGNYTIPLNVTKLKYANEFTVASVTPSQLNLTFDYIDTKQFTVVPLVKGVSAVSGLVAEEPVISNATEGTVTVKGPRTEVDKISGVVALVEAQEVLSETKTYDAAIMLLDKNDNELDKSSYTVSAKGVKVSVPISKRKTVSVKPVFKNAPDGYERLLKYSLSATTVNIIGPAETVDSINEISLSPIDFFSISKTSASFETTPVLVDGIKILDNFETVTLKVDVNSLAEKTVKITNVKAVNNENGYQVLLVNAIQNVKICGPKDVIQGIKENTLYASVDLSGKTAGDYTALAVIQSEAGGKIWQVGTYQASITVK